MNTIIESAKIALAAIWSAKLRSFMTVLGNIVAVTSIIAVVSLIQGLNASVKQAILDEAGAESFSIQRYPVTRSDEDFDRVRSNPIITMQDMRAIQRYGGEQIAAIMANTNGRGRITFRDKSIDNTQVEGVSSSYVNFSGYTAERGRLMPQFISAPIPYSDTESLKAGVNYFPDLPDSFYTNNEFPACNIHIGAKEITAQTKANQ